MQADIRLMEFVHARRLLLLPFVVKSQESWGVNGINSASAACIGINLETQEWAGFLSTFDYLSLCSTPKGKKLWLRGLEVKSERERDALRDDFIKV